MNLFREVLDKEIVDREGFKGGKVDDLLLELRDGEPPAVRSIITGEGAGARLLGGWMLWLDRHVRRMLLGQDNVEPATVPWERVTKIDVVVHTDLIRREAGLTASEQAIWDRWISRLPFAER